MGKTRGQPKIKFFVRYCIAYKVIQYQRRYNLTPYKAWILFSQHRGFKDLMAEHFSNKDKKYFEGMLAEPKYDEYEGTYQDPLKNFYKNHIRKIIEQFPTIKILTPKEYKESLQRIKARKNAGIGSLKYLVKRPRKS